MVYLIGIDNDGFDTSNYSNHPSQIGYNNTSTGRHGYSHPSVQTPSFNQVYIYIY